MFRDPGKDSKLQIEGGDFDGSCLTAATVKPSKVGRSRLVRLYSGLVLPASDFED